jgi:hypothetical protein
MAQRLYRCKGGIRAGNAGKAWLGEVYSVELENRASSWAPSQLEINGRQIKTTVQFNEADMMWQVERCAIRTNHGFETALIKLGMRIIDPNPTLR